jgi:AcrR family transcriptional regulator
MEAIARRAGVSKETLYRWWRSKSEVILDALAERGRQTIPLPDTGALAGDLLAFLRATVDSADPTTVRLLHTIASAAASDEAFAAEVRDRFLATRRADLRQLLERGVERGEITPDLAGFAVDLVYGSMWYRLIFQIGPLDYTWAEAVVASITAGGP